MKTNILSQLLVMAAFASAATSQAQVGIGTNSPSASAQLELSSASKGFLPPRVTLTGTADVTTIASPATGLMVYNTATAGTAPANVTPGIYYYDGAKWQRVINQQPDATVEFNTANPNSGSPTFTPNTPASKDYVYVSSVDNSQWTYNGSAYVTYTPPASTPWMRSGGTIDAGSNKADPIYRTGSVGIGSTTTPNSSALLDVNSTTKGFLPPRMTTAQRNAIGSPADGLVIFNTSTDGLEIKTSSAWAKLVVADPVTYVSSGGRGPGYYVDIGNIRIQWGEISNTNTTRTLTFPVDFADANYGINFQYIGSAAAANAVNMHTMTQSGLTIVSDAWYVRWVAIGKK
ncbi:MAG: hypothetical protein FJ347_07425 [Sphingomonadales bacterium]|nr:hypothetical protein [Sphingomonadales bacterium]